MTSRSTQIAGARAWAVIFWIVVAAGPLMAQTGRTISIKMLDSKNGRAIATPEFEVSLAGSVGKDQYIRTSADGTAQLTVTPSAEFIEVHARDGVWGFVNCDSVKDRAAKSHKYALADILGSGVVAPNHCSKHTAIAKPGEFVFL